MNATKIIEYLRSNNFDVRADGEYIDLSPAEKVTDELIQRLRKHKPEILRELRAESQRKLEKIRAWLISIGEPENDFHIVFDKCRRDPGAMEYFLQQANDHARDKRQEKVQAMLRAHPDKQRAYLTEIEPDSGNVILIIAIRGKATFEMLIPQAKHDPFLLAEMIDKDLIH